MSQAVLTLEMLGNANLGVQCRLWCEVFDYKMQAFTLEQVHSSQLMLLLQALASKLTPLTGQ